MGRSDSTALTNMGTKLHEVPGKDERITKSTQIACPAGRCIVVVPCFNEETRLRPRQFSEFLAADDQVNFLFVNDGSSDGTLRILESLRANHPDRVEVLDKQPNGGKAEAVRSGMVRAMALDGFAYTGFWDADLATPLNVIPQLLSKLVKNPKLQMIFGSRVRLLGHAIHRNPLRHYLGRCFATAVSIVLGIAHLRYAVRSKTFPDHPRIAVDFRFTLPVALDF